MQLTQAVGALHRVLFPGHPCVCHLTRRRQAKDMSLVRVAIAYVGHEALQVVAGSCIYLVADSKAQ